MSNRRLIRIGGVCALIVTVMQVVGNAMHPPLPPDSVESLEIIASTPLWNIVHLDITVSYFMFIPFVIGAAASFSRRSPLVPIAAVLVIVSAGLGVVQILTHLTIFKHLADAYSLGGDAATASNFVFLYEMLWPYSIALEAAHLFAIYVAAVMFGIAMLEETIYPRWVGWLGIGSGIVAALGFGIGKGFVRSAQGDVIFGLSLIPLVAWIAITGVVLLRAQLPEQEEPTLELAPSV